MAKVYTSCIEESKIRVKMCGPVLPMVLKGLGYGVAYAAAAIAAIAAFMVIPVASGAGIFIAIAIAAYVGLAAFYAGFFQGMCTRWLNERLICLDSQQDPHCVIGRVMADETVDKGFLGFDIDSHFNLRLMPHVETDADENKNKNSMNFLFKDGQQGQEFLARRLMSWTWSDDESKLEGKRTHLHCEFETNYWFKVCEVSEVLAPLAPVLITITTPSIEAACNAVASIFGFLSPLINIFCRFLAPVLAMALVTLLNLALARAIADPGSSTDANIGDRPKEPLKENEPVVIIGNFVYDAGHCIGWHEIHPVLAVMRITPPEQYLERFAAPLIGVSPNKLTQADMNQGLDSPDFAKAAKSLKDFWCSEINRARGAKGNAEQLLRSQRWAVHPLIDSCKEDEARTSPRPIIK
jgi:hypothetical protein